MVLRSIIRIHTQKRILTGFLCMLVLKMFHICFLYSVWQISAGTDVYCLCDEKQILKLVGLRNSKNTCFK